MIDVQYSELVPFELFRGARDGRLERYILLDNVGERHRDHL